MKAALFIFFAGTILTGRAQDLKQDLAVMNAHLEQLPDYRISVDYSAGDTSDLSDSGSASVLVSPKDYFYLTEFASMIINEQHTIIVNEEERTLIWSENQQRSKHDKPLNTSLLEGIDTLIASADSVYFTPNGNKRTYHLRFNNSYFDLVELTFEGLYLSHVLYFYNPAVSGEQGLTASCSVRIEEHPDYDRQLLTSDFYFTQLKGGNALPTEAFTGYVLIYNASIESSIE